MNLLDWFFSIRINYKIFPHRIAKKLPLCISHKTRCIGLRKNCIDIDGEIKRFMFSYGIVEGSVGEYGNRKNTLMFVGNGKLIIDGYSTFCQGAVVRVFDNANLIIKNGSWFNADCTISCSKRIEIGQDFLAGWDVAIRDSDGHKLISAIDSKVLNEDKDIIISDHVWVGADTLISKGTILPQNTVVAGRSLVNKEYIDENIVLAGVPARIVKRNINWK